MTKFVNVDIAEDVQPFFFNENFQFGSDAMPEFQLAFGLSTFMEFDHTIDDDFGSFSAHYEYWSPTENAETPIISRPCTPKDFGIEPNDR
jgi:hypothetical protein